ncbi:release factor glutamine methyltransferase [Methylobacterium sp. BE186]|uniref:peptide chain release factor N(5)-glutamine methyltransferase n=1 Tax=Methylobacterium sp. BE186 TaxID=2817715 RepID=UPI00286113A3|nr:peptide chain release factor N(5)-glutamine methyltransferase [Methylobacterium sp. BE186]MDR7037818.1 release factor glutamine methyltransferase [Methylobacterium sp. BE186]
MNPPRFAPDLSRRAALRLFERILAASGNEGAVSDARFLVPAILGLSPLDLAARGDVLVGAEGAAALDAAVARRLSGEPVARILGAWEFWGLPFRLSSETLVPRPDTETLVEAALAALPGRDGPPSRILDLGTGSGCLLVAILSEARGAFGIGLDRSEAALRTARENARLNGVEARAGFILGDWCASLRGPFDLIVSNPPYIASGVIPSLSPEVRLHDPMMALDGGIDGLDAYRRIIAEVMRGDLLREEGSLCFEVGHDQAESVRALGIGAGLEDAAIRYDLAGHARVVALRRSPAGGSRRKS